MKKVIKPKRKYPLLQKDLYVDTTTNPSRETETNTHTRRHIKGLNKSTFITVTTGNKGVLESHTNNHLNTLQNDPCPYGPPGQESGATLVVTRFSRTRIRRPTVNDRDQNRPDPPRYDRHRRRPPRKSGTRRHTVPDSIIVNTLLRNREFDRHDHNCHRHYRPVRSGTRTSNTHVHPR